MVLQETVGLDFGIVNNRINGSVDVYNRLSEDVISILELPGELGVSGGILANASSVRNKGQSSGYRRRKLGC